MKRKGSLHEEKSEFAWILMILYQFHCSVDYIKKNEMLGACSTYGGKGRHMQGFSGET